MITGVSEENRHSLQAQLVPECCSMRNLDRNQPAAGSSSISEKIPGRGKCIIRSPVVTIS